MQSRFCRLILRSSPIVSEALGFVGLEPLALWRNFSVYQITGDGWGNGMEPAGDLPWQTIGDLDSEHPRRNGPEAISQHYLSSYVAGLADCCDEVALPFTRPVWNILFGTEDNAWGGMMLGNPFAQPWTTGSSGLVLGGDGAIIPVGDGILLESGDFVLTESAYHVLLE